MKCLKPVSPEFNRVRASEALLERIKVFREKVPHIRGLEYTYQQQLKLNMLEVLAVCATEGAENLKISELSEMANTNRYAAQKTLRDLFKMGICDRKRLGKFYTYSLSDDYLRGYQNVF